MQIHSSSNAQTKPTDIVIKADKVAAKHLARAMACLVAQRDALQGDLEPIKKARIRILKAIEWIKGKQ